MTRERAQREGGRRKRQDEDYNELFLRRNEIKTRQCVYITPLLRSVPGMSKKTTSGFMTSAAIIL